MEAAVTIIVLVLGIMFLVGLATAIVSFLFNKSKRHPIFTIVFSVLLIPLIYIPITYTIGFGARLIIVLLIPYSIAMIIWAIKNKKSNFDEKI